MLGIFQRLKRMDLNWAIYLNGNVDSKNWTRKLATVRMMNQIQVQMLSCQTHNSHKIREHSDNFYQWKDFPNSINCIQQQQQQQKCGAWYCAKLFRTKYIRKSTQFILFFKSIVIHSIERIFITNIYINCWKHFALQLWLIMKWNDKRCKINSIKCE